eukprot:scaffold39942_cov59-Phaeocystis_antarctica.AAC.2
MRLVRRIRQGGGRPPLALGPRRVLLRQDNATRLLLRERDGCGELIRGVPLAPWRGDRRRLHRLRLRLRHCSSCQRRSR